MASPFAVQLGTNYCPKDEEVLEIKSHLVEPTQRLRRLDEMIADLQKTIDKLVEERDGLGIYVDAHKALISPARRLPLDIVQEIFVACLPTHRNCVMSASEAPVLLGRICSSWRALSLTTPRLWANLHIVEPPRGRYGSSDTLVDEKVMQRLDTMKMWLGRSGQCPLSISLQSGPDYESPPATPTTLEERGAPAGADSIRRHRLSSMRLHISPPADVPMLESVAFYPQQNQFLLRSLDWENFGMLSGPRLTNFSTRGNSFTPQILPLHWQQLTALAIEGPAWETVMTSEATLQILARCSQLRTCRWTVNELGIPVVAVGLGLLHPPVELPFLHTLELDLGTVPSSLPSRLLLPQLRELTLHGRTDEHHIAPFFNASTRLETLNIDSNSFTKTSLLESLCALPPTMRHLTIYDISSGSPLRTPLDDDVLVVLTPAPELSTVCCPSLETLAINFSSLISDEALLRFVTQRMASPSGSEPTLKRVDVQFNRRMTSDIMPTLKPFVEETGLDFSPWQGLADAPSAWGFASEFPVW
ncbi:hypothetical protein B0H14DRAFT_3758419 [Mycena olivaceomarginata]|nr:hypothetical protein B0H14DRAFT_3758419 [Mycena olivaceomarginata]